MKKYNAGFTLIELMVVIAIAAILMLVAVPNMTSLLQKNAVESYQQNFLRDLAYARDLAVNRNTRISVCASETGTNCSGNNQWEEGWIIFANTPGSDETLVDGTDEVVRVEDGFSRDGAMTLDTGTAGEGMYFTFSPRGAVQIADVDKEIQMKLCDSDNVTVRGALLLNSGRIIPSRIDASHNVYVKTGVPLVCP